MRNPVSMSRNQENGLLNQLIQILMEKNCCRSLLTLLYYTESEIMKDLYVMSSTSELSWEE